MGNYLKGETPSTIYKQLLSVGASADRAGLTASLKPVWTDDGGSSANLAPFQLSTAALSFNTTKQLQFRDTAIYLNSSTDGQLDIVADGEVQIGTAILDVNASGAVTIDGNSIGLTGTTTLNSATTVSGALTCSSTTALNGITTLGSGIALRVGAAEEYISGDTTNLTIASGVDINLTATADVNLPASVGLTFGADTEKIEGTGSNVLAMVAGGALTLTGGAASTWSTGAGILTIDGAGGVVIAGNSAEVDITTSGTLDINAGVLDIDVTAGLTIDATTMSIDGTDDSNITVTGTGKDLTVAAAGGGTQTLILSSAGTGADALQITSSAGGIDISNVGSSGDDIDITATSDDTSIHLQATNNTDADAITMKALVGGIDITGGSGGDIDIASVGKSVNISSTENAANALYLRANGGTAETIKIHADQSTADKAIEIIADAGGVDIQAAKTGYGIKIGDDTSGVPILLGHSTSEVTVGDNLTVTGDLTVSGTQSYSSLAVSHASATTFTLDNQEHSNSDGARDITFKFTGENGSGASVDDMAQIVVAHDGSSSDEKGFIDFRPNSGSEGTSPTSALKLSADKTATFGGAITTTGVITGGRVTADNIMLDGNTLITTDTDGDLTIAPNGNGGIVFFSGTASGNDAIAWNGGTASGTSAFSGGGAGTASGTSSFVWGTGTSSGTGSGQFGVNNTTAGVSSFTAGNGCSNAGDYSIAAGLDCNTTTGVYGQTSFGQKALSRHMGQIALSSGTTTGTTEGQSQASIIHTSEQTTLDGTTWVTVDGGSGAFTFENDTVVMAQTLIVMSTAGAASTVGFKIEWLGQNDGGTENVIASTVTEFNSEDTTLAAQVAVVGDTFAIQVRDDTGANTGVYAVSCVTTWSQVTFA
jgi:hypothetical protein